MDFGFAIQWVKSNIDNFGGDSKNICIFGESGGGFSVGFQSMSPLNAALFQRSIFESGSIPWTSDLAVRTASVAFKLGHEVNCTDVGSHGNTDTRRLIDCLRRIPASVLLFGQNPSASNKEGEFSLLAKLGPVVDGEFAVGDLMTLLKNRSSPVYQTFTNLDIMAGTNNAEGGLAYFDLKGYQENFHFNITEGIPVDVLCDLVAPSIARDYFKNNTKARSTVDAFADVAFHALNTMMIEIHSNLNVEEGGKTYQYLFSHQPAYPWTRERPGWLVGTSHADELPFVFGLHAMNPPDANKPADEMVLSSKVMRYWTNFAKYGNPNGPGLTYWPQYFTSEKYYMDLNIPTAARQRLYEDRMRLWTEIIPHMTNNKTVPKSHNGGQFSSVAELCVSAKVPLILIILTLQMVY